MRTELAYKEADAWLNQETVFDAGPSAPPICAGPTARGAAVGQTKNEFLVGELMKSINLQIFKRDKAGNLEYNAGGRVQIDWVAVLTGLIKLVGKIIALSKLHEAQQVK
jgi:hypothetical protein